MPLPIVPTKELLREEIKKHLNTVSGEEFFVQGERAAALLRSSSVWSSYESIFLFLSIKSEIDTQALLKAALKEGKKVFAPRVEAGRLVFCPLLSPDGPWQKGPFGIREPAAPPGVSSGEGPAALNYFPALILTPGLAFDREGNRLGRGGGYYDRFFAELDGAGREYFALGFCMDFQLVDRVPAEEQDKKVNGLLTGTELITCPE